MEIHSGYAPTREGLSIYYERWGNPANPPVLMVMGLGAQMTIWPEALLKALVERGLYLILFDNRDIGLSSATPHAKPQALSAFVRSRLGLKVHAPYNLDDMAADAIDLLNYLGIERASVVGASMGGMIAQILAVEYPDRICSLTGIMTSPNEGHLPRPPVKLLLQLAGLRGEPIVDAESAAENRLQLWRMINSPDYLMDEDIVRQRAAASYRRSYRPDGAAKHSLAIMATGGFKDRLARIRLPSLFIHGGADRLVHPEGGKLCARATPGAELMLIKGMGHEIPEDLTQRLAEKIAKHIASSAPESAPD
ncbi:MAG: alpha/beta fold hydrolase [Pseudomonadota bacterium]